MLDTLNVMKIRKQGKYSTKTPKSHVKTVHLHMRQDDARPMEEIASHMAKRTIFQNPRLAKRRQHTGYKLLNQKTVTKTMETML